MNTESTAEKILNSIRQWSRDDQNLVVGIDGYSGAGKTTLLKKILEIEPSIKGIFMDDIVATANKKEHLMPQIESGDTLDLEWAPADGLEKLKKMILDLKNDGTGNFIIVEGVFLFHPDVLNDVWDKRIYLDTDEEKADERRIAREMKRWGKDYFHHEHPDSFFRLFKIAHKRYKEIYEPMKKADLIVHTGS